MRTPWCSSNARTSVSGASLPLLLWLLLLALPTGGHAAIDYSINQITWKLMYGVTDAQINDPVWMASDSDGDGLKNSDEMLAGTNPFFKAQGQPHFVVAGVMGDATTLTLTFPTVYGKVYQAEGKVNLTDTTWFTAGLPGTVGDGGTKQLVVQKSAGKFFRVRVQDQDSQGDGLSDWARKALGFSPSAPINSQSSFTSSSLATTLQAQNVVTLVPVDLSTTQPTDDQTPASDLGLIRVTRSGYMLLSAITVPLLKSGTAVEGTDYAAMPSSITFPAGVNSLDVYVTPLFNANRTTSATVILAAGAPGSPSSAGGYTLGTPSTASVTIYPSGNPVGTGLVGAYYVGSNATYASPVNFGGATTNYSYTKTNTTTGSAVVTYSGTPSFSAGSKVNLQFSSGNLSGGSYDVVYTIASATSTTLTVTITGVAVPNSGSGNCVLNPPVLTRLDSTVDFLWNSGVPSATSLPTAGSDNWAGRFDGYLNPPTTGSYDFDIQADDGARVYVNGTLVIDAWNPGSSTFTPMATSASISLTAGTRVPIRVEYYDLNGSASVSLRWKKPGDGSFSAIPAANVFLDNATSTTGWTALYWTNTQFIGLPRFGDFPSAITLSWGTGQPQQTLPSTDNFSARWDGYFSPSTTGSYQFDIQASDGARVYLDLDQGGTFGAGETIIDAWTPADAASVTPAVSGTYSLTAGQKYKMRVEYYEGTGTALVKLRAKVGAGSFAAINASANVYRADPATGAATTTLGWWSTFYNNNALTDPPLYAVQETSSSSVTYDISTGWTSGKPATSNLGTSTSDNWGSRFDGYIKATGGSGTYTFQLAADDGASLDVNGSNVVPMTAGTTTGSINLNANDVVPIRVQHYELTGNASVVLSWKTPAAPSSFVTVPTTSLFRDAGATTAGVTGTYWTNTGLLGAYSFADYQTQINYNVTSSQPNQTLVPTEFSATWDGYISPPSTGNYVFDIQADDQAKVYINDVLVIDAWTVPNSSTVTPMQSGAVALTAGTRAKIHVEFADASGAAVIKLRWATPTAPATFVGIPNTVLFRDATTSQLGLLATYYANTTLTAPFAYQIAENNTTAITYDFGVGSPDPALPKDNYVARWTGQVLPQYSEPYYFTVKSDDGAKLWVNGQLIIDGWASGSTERISAPINLQADVLYDIKLEYMELTGSAEAHLNWYCDDQAKQIIPSSRLFPTMTGLAARPGDPPAGAPAIISATSAVALLGAGSPFSFTLAASNGGSSFSATGLPPWLTLTNGVLSGTPTQAGIYQFTVTTTNAAGSGSAVITVEVKDTGSTLTRELWTSGVGGANLSNVPWTSAPTTTDTLAVMEDNTTTYGANTGERLRGYITAPATGNYYFWLSASNVAELWISNDAEPVNKVRRAYVTGPTGTSTRTWNTQISGTTGANNQRSGWLAMTAGQKYYFEVLHNTGASGSGNNLSVGWFLDPTGSTASPIANGSGPAAPNGVSGGVVSGYVLSPWDNPPTTAVSGNVYVANFEGVSGLSNIKATGGAFLRVNGSTGVLHLNASGLSSGVVFRRVYATPVGNNPPQLLFDIGAQDTFYPGLKTSDAGYTWSMSPSDLSTLSSGGVFVLIGTVNNPNGEITGTFSLTSGSQTPPTPPSYPTPADDHGTTAGASRFLTQATFGPSPGDIAYVNANGFRAWIEAQLTTPATHHVPLLLAGLSADPTAPYPSTLTFNAWWQNSVTAPDQLRQRVAFALSEILVVSDTGPLNTNGRTLSDHYDTLLDYAFDNYRNILKQITLTSAMGVYLDMRGNALGNIATGIHPNENYAREIMQLFSVGLYRRWPDGSLILDSTGNAVPTYDQTVITGLARVFTGWTWGQAVQSNGRLPTSFGPAANYLDPMVLVPTQHELGTKILLDNVILPAATVTSSGDTSTSPYTITIQSSNPSGVLGDPPVSSVISNNYDLNGLRDLEATIDSIHNNSSVGPYICRQLIQRLVTSHPKPDYVYRVVQAFNGERNVDGVATGVRGDMKEVIRAILLDYEARSSTAKADVTFGKQREPLLRITGPARSFPVMGTLADGSTSPYPQTSSTYSQNGGQPIAITTPNTHRLISGDTVLLDTFVDGGGSTTKLPTATSYTVANVTPTYTFVGGATDVVTVNSPGYKVGDTVAIQFTSGVLGTTSPYNTVRNYTVTGVTTTGLTSGTFTVKTGNTSLGNQSSAANALLPKSFTVNAGSLSTPSYTVSGTTVTVNAGTSSSYFAGHQVYLKFPTGGLNSGAYDGQYTIATATTSTFTVTLGSNPGTSTGGNCIIPRMTGGYVITTSGNTSTITVSTQSNTNLAVGNTVQLEFVAFPNGAVTTAAPSTVYTVTAVIDPDHFQVTTSPAVSNTSQSTSALVAYPLTAPTYFTRNGTVTVNQGTWNMGYTTTATPDIGQTPLNSVTVFNFFYPDYSFPGPIAQAGLTTPEFQLTNDTSTMNLTNFITQGVLNAGNTNGFTSFKTGGGAIVMDLGPYMTAAQTADAAIPTLVTQIGDLLTGGNLQAATKTYISNYVANTTNFPYTTGSPTPTQMRDRVRAIVHLILISPEYAIQK